VLQPAAGLITTSFDVVHSGEAFAHNTRAGAPKNAHLVMVYSSLRYVLP